MRILFLSATLGDAYGQERIMRETNLLLRNLGHQTFYVAESLVGPLPENDGHFMIPNLTRFNLLSSPKKIAQTQKALLDILEKTQCELVHFVDIVDFRLMNFLSKRVPCFFTAHTVAPTCPSSQRFFPLKGGVCEKPSGIRCFPTHSQTGCLRNYKSLLHRLHAFVEFSLKKRSLKKFPALGAISPYIKNCLLKDTYSSNQVIELFNPVAVSQNINPLTEAPSPLLVVASRLVSLKGIDALLRSLGTLIHRPWHLWIFGEGPQKKEWVELAKSLGLSERVIFKGKVSSEVFHSSLLSASVFIQPNRGPEGFGLSAAEALALGVPVVAYDVPALNDLIQNNQTGFLIPLEKEKDLATAIEKLLDNPELASSMGKEAKKVAERFSIQNHLQQLLSAYKKCQDRFHKGPAPANVSYGVHFKEEKS